MQHPSLDTRHAGGHEAALTHGRASAEPDSQSPEVEHTCPMHPEVVQAGPGSCPICGMALEPRSITAEPPDNAELRDMLRRLLWSAALSTPLLFIAMGHMVSPWLNRVLPSHVRIGVEFLLATPVVFYGAWPFFVRFVASIRTRHLNMFTLIGLGVGTAYLYSVVGLLLPSLFPPQLKDPHGTVNVYFEASAVITALVLLGQVLELRARAHTGSAVRALLGISPKTAHVVTEDGDEEVPIEHLAEGDRVRIRPGERVPIDAIIISGESSLDESMMTGESIPVDKGPGDTVIGGTLNAQGALLARVARVGKDTVLSQIVHQVADAQRSRAPIQRLADQVSSYFVPTVVVAAVVTALVWWLFGGQERALAITNAVAVLIIACPCALGLATPISIMVAMGRGATAGVLFKDAEAIELLGRVDTLVVDKTGTLTQGKPQLVGIWPRPGEDPDDILKLAASLEQGSEHPVAAAIAAAAKERNLAVTEPDQFTAVSGKGVRGRVANRDVVIGTAPMLSELGVADLPSAASLDERRGEGQSVILVGIDGTFAAVLAVADPIKDSAAAALTELREDKLHVVMLTGDSRMTANSVARQLGIEEVMAEVLPDQKASAVQRFKDDGRWVAMAGDGINDAPALATAHVGVAMGTGTDVAIHSAQVTLVKGDLRGIARARRLSRATMGNIKENLFFAFAYNVVGVPIAAGALYPLFGWLLNPMLAALAMSLSSVSVIANAARLRAVDL